MFISGPCRPIPATRKWTCVNNTHQLIGTVTVASDSSTRCIPDVGMSEPFPSDRNDVVRQRFVGNACSKLQSTCVWQNAHPSVSPVSTLNNVAQNSRRGTACPLDGGEPYVHGALKYSLDMGRSAKVVGVPISIHTQEVHEATSK